jgi:hypothetical protein
VAAVGNPTAAAQHPESTVMSARTQQAETVMAEAPPGASEISGLGASRLGDLDEKQLKALLTEIDQLQATPITEPDPVTIRVDTKGSTTNPEGL